jgi:hypothetical protein
VEQATRKRLDLIEPVSARLEMGGLFTIIGYGQELLVDPANALSLGISWSRQRRPCKPDD